MLETGSPPDDEQQKTRSVSPLSFLRASRSSTPGISSLDGSPRYFFALPSPPPRPRSASPLGMAVQSFHPSKRGHQERSPKGKPTPIHGAERQHQTKECPEAPPFGDDAVQGHPLDPVPSLSELTQLLRLEKYQAKKCKQIQRQLYQAQTIAARTSRLANTARSIQRTLAECIKSEDKHSFINLFNALHDSLDLSEAANGSDSEKWTEDANGIDYPDSFVDSLPSESRSAVLDFLLKVRHDGNFIADRLAALTHRELVSLLPEKGQPRSTESIFGSSPRTSSRTSRHLGFVADGQTELLSSFEYGCALETLVFSVRGVSGPNLASDPIATDVWSTVCARLISEQKPGCERLVPAVINLWALFSPWPGKDRLGIWISQALQNGMFLQEQPSKQTFRLRAQGVDSNAEDEARKSQFYANSVNSLLALLGEQNEPCVIPDGAITLCQAICRKLNTSTDHQRAFPNFVLRSWLFSSFLPDAITLPEIHGLMTDSFFTGTTRKSVLREIAGRAQRKVFDVIYSWKYGTTVSLEITGLVGSVASRFHLPTSQSHLSNGFNPRKRPNSEDTLIPISLADINTMVSALCPKQRPGSIVSDFDPSHGGLQSSASSVSGLSLFQNPGAADLGHRIFSTSNQDLSQPDILDSTSLSIQENAFQNDRVDSVLQPDWDSDQLWEACAAMDDFMSDRTSSGPNPWCALIKPSGSETLHTLKHALTKTSKFPDLADQVPLENAGDLINRQKSRDAIEELLSDVELDISSDQTAENADSLDPSGLQQAFRAAFEKRIEEFRRSSDIVAAHYWFRKLRHFKAFVSGSTGCQNLLIMLDNMKREKEQSFHRSLRLSDTCELWTRSLKPAFDIYSKELQLRSEVAGRLRDKMWYVAEVRISAAYDEARLIASALKVMGKPKQPQRTRLAPPLRHWSGSRVSTSGLQVKTEAQTLELLSAPPDYGGPNKLSDDQSRAVSLWMERNTVENLCLGEERLHKLCMEIRRAVDQITAETSPLLSSTLFARDKTSNTSQPRSNSNNPFWPSQAGSSRFDLLTLQTNVPSTIDSLSSASSHPLSARSSRDYLDARSPALTNRSSVPFWSPVVTEARSPSSATSIGSSQTHAAGSHPGRHPSGLPKTSNQNLIEQLRQRTTGLLLSELASAVFGNGSETDRAFWTGLGGDMTKKHFISLRQGFSMASPNRELDDTFDFEQSFRDVMGRFEATSNPFTKLRYLLDIDALLAPYMAQTDNTVSPRPDSQLNTHALHKLKRQGSSQASIKVEGFRRLLCDSTIRPAAIFRDLQYIAALVPSNILESTPQGKAFWNVAVAVSSLKQEVRQLMIETADGIISYHSNNRGHGRTASIAQQERDSATFSVPSRTPSAEDIKRYTMADAAYLLQITAKEGDPAAQRELATLYLTHPELMDHIISPFSRPRDVFKEELESKWRKNQDPNRCDPVTMCVAHHWMSLSNKAGDGLAKEYLKQREEMDMLG